MKNARSAEAGIFHGNFRNPYFFLASSYKGITR
jgi:hypothetical protein